MNNTIKLLLIFIITQTLFGCSASRYISSLSHEEAVSIYVSTNYPDQLTDEPNRKLRQRTLFFGPYMPNISGGGGGFSDNNLSYEGPMKGEEIVALWRMPIKQKMLHYYVRSEPGKGIIRTPREGHSTYSVGVALGPMRVLKGGLTKEQLKDSNVAGYGFYGDPVYYRWGVWDKLYYTTGIFSSRDLQTKPHSFHEIQGIAITAVQYDRLYERCNGEWEAVKCFMDESFPDLTPEQLAYIKSRKHPDDDDRLANKFPKPKPYINRYN
jgi:hypothetical protein